jgi:fused signal recognition particle receptor
MMRKITLLSLVLGLVSLGLSSTAQVNGQLADWLPLAQLSGTGIFLLSVLVVAVMGARHKNYQLPVLSLTFAVLVILTAHTYLLSLSFQAPLIPLLSMLQMLCGFISVWLLFRLYLRLNPQLILNSVTQSPPVLLKATAKLVLLLQIVLGCWVSVNSAGLVCGADLPLCKPELLQKADYQAGLNVIDSIVNHYQGKLSFNARVAVHWLHRIGGLVTFIILSLLMLSATSEQYSKPIRRSGLALSALLLIQITLGIFTIKLASPLWLDIAHNLMAALLMLPLMAISFYSRHGFADSEQAAEVIIEAGKPQVKVSKPETGDPLYLRLKTQLGKTRTGLGGILGIGKKAVNEDLLEEIEEKLLLADIGIEATTEIIDKLTDNLEQHQLNNGETLFAALKQDLLDILKPCSQPLQIPKQDKPFVILVVGINGVGKTTTIGKLAKKLQLQGHSVMLAAGDTFRAAAVEQLQVWGERNEIPVVAQHTGADSASVIFDALQSAQAKGIDVLIADTAGRLHTKSHLMEELKKIKRIISKLDDAAPHEVLLVLDAGTGQNALSQAKLFNEAVNLTGLALTKLDGTAKGGIIFALAKQLSVAIRYIGVGEGIDDLQEFNAQNFVDALFVSDE